MRLPGSKSMTQRALLLAALAYGDSQLYDIGLCEDTLTFMQALKSLGIDLSYHEETQRCCVRGCGGVFPNAQARLWCQDSGITLRFLLAVCAAQQGQFSFDGSARLCARPLRALVEVLHQQGVNTSSAQLPLCIQTSGLEGGQIFIPGEESSQFLSALLIAAPLMKRAVTLQTGKLVSQPYVAMTTRMQQQFGVSVAQREDVWHIETGQSYQACDYTIESDLSSASYFFAWAAVMGRDIFIEGVDRQACLQGDIEFLSVLECMGCVVEQQSLGVKVIGPTQLRGVEVDMRDMSDTMMTLAAIAPFADRPTIIRNIANTRLKESDRIEAMAYNLRALGIRVEANQDSLVIYPGVVKPAELSSYGDHRIAMACGVIAAKVPDIEIDGGACVAKTFPHFFELLNRLVK